MGIYGKSYVGVRFFLQEYVSPRGRKAITDWREDLSIVRRAELDTFLRIMVRKSQWNHPDIGGLSGKHLKGFKELRWKSEHVPHRIGGYFASDREFVMLIGWTHNSKKYDPPNAFETLIERRRRLDTKEASANEYPITIGR